MVAMVWSAAPGERSEVRGVFANSPLATALKIRADMWLDALPGLRRVCRLRRGARLSTGSFSASKDEPFFGNADVGTRDPSDNNSGLCAVGASPLEGDLIALTC